MTISDRTLLAVAKAIRESVNAWAADEDLAEAALKAFAEAASLDDWDQLESLKP